MQAPPSTRIAAGEIIDGKFRVERVLGVGGMGVVVAARQLGLERRVALKLVRASSADGADGGRIARFLREARAVARLRSEHVARVLDVATHAGTPYIVMEYLEGADLASLLRERGALPVSDAVDYLLQACEAIAEAHSRGIVHRDLKPENVMLLEAGDRTDHVKVLDFGIALMDDREGGDRLTATDAVQGTPLYMSPEQCRGRDVGPPTDIYAIGAMLYEMLAGLTPFVGRSVVDVMAQHMFMTPPSISERSGRMDTPAELERLAMWALAKRAEDRPTATQFRDALAAMARGAGTAQVAARSHEERIRAMALSRNERGLPVPDAALSPTLLRAADNVMEDGRPLVLLAGFSPEESHQLAGALSVQGIDARPWTREEVPAKVDANVVRAVVLAGPKAAAQLAAARANKETARLPILVADIRTATDTPALVRAGASDVALASIGDDVLGAKLWRLIRRGR